MQKREQILYMQTRMIRLAIVRWHKTLIEVVDIFEQFELAQYIEDNFALYHTEGDEAVFADLEQILSAEGVSLNDKLDR